MASVEKTVLVMHSAERMFDLVEGVERYPEFLPWCGGASVHTRTPTEMEATIRIAFKGITQQFTTHNLHQRGEFIHMRFKEGPFKSFEGRWQFFPLTLPASNNQHADAAQMNQVQIPSLQVNQKQACKIVFNLHYEFSSKWVEKIIGPVFNHIANTFVDSFVKRAELLYA